MQKWLSIFSPPLKGAFIRLYLQRFPRFGGLLPASQSEWLQIEVVFVRRAVHQFAIRAPPPTATLTVSVDMRWRAIVLVYMYGIEMAIVSSVFGVSVRSIERWIELFKKHGNVLPKTRAVKTARWPEEAVLFVEEFMRMHPCFYLEELQEAVRGKFSGSLSTSTPAICRPLRFDLKMSRKVLTRRVRESVSAEIEMFYKKLSPFHSGPDQLVFMDETSKDGRDALRKYAWSRRNTPAIVSLPFARGERVSVLAAFNVSGFFAWASTPGTFDRAKFHDIVKTKIAPFLNPWPLPRCEFLL